MRVIILLAIILLGSTIQAQHEAASQPRFGLHLMPLSVTNVLPRYRLGGMVMTERMSYLLDVEFGSNRTLSTLSWSDPADGFVGVRPEVRRLLTSWQAGQIAYPYLGLELPVTYYERTMEDRDYIGRDGIRYSFDRARQERLRITAIMKGGVVICLTNHLYFDLYGGLGYGGRRVRYLDEINRRPFTLDAKRKWANPDIKRAGWIEVLELAAGFRVGFLF